MAIPCGDWCDPTTPRQFEQSAARYNDGSAQAATMALNNQHHAQHTYLSAGVNQIANQSTAATILALGAINQGTT